ncbi:histidine phosphatase family protein [Nostocoides sp.]|jgi:broad specificity phosphatase PhoE|uniref:histidine phosphatase family protein n=1 Tax=Nostocoides sp. TaxID=1917966 RepID=UPI002BABFDB1|nr:histidine phosphatase family protein [Tetrasphaera sp.]
MTAHPPSEAPVGRLVLLRHGETAWSRSGQHTGRTDIPLTEHGEDLARAAGNLLAGHTFGLVLASPLQRAWRTAELAGLTAEREDNLVEWDYGAAEGRTTAEIRADVGYAWSAFTHGVTPGKTPGESIEEVAARMALVLARVTPVLRERDVALVGHGHALRILTSVFLRQEVRFAAQLLLDAGSVSVLRYDKEFPAVHTWNRLPSLV